jgi:hypothetical protein
VRAAVSRREVKESSGAQTSPERVGHPRLPPYFVAVEWDWFENYAE